MKSGCYFASAVAGLTYIMLSFATLEWHLYAAMAILGLCRALDVNSWKILFYSHLEPELKGRTISTYDAIYGITVGAMAAIAGFVGELYGFRTVIFAAGLLIFASSIPALSLRSDDILKDSKKSI